MDKIVIDPPHELASNDDEYRWYHLYFYLRPEMVYGTVVAKSWEDAVRVFNLETALGVFIADLIAVPLPTKVSQRYIDRYHRLFDDNKFLNGPRHELSEVHMAEIRYHYLRHKEGR